MLSTVVDDLVIENQQRRLSGPLVLQIVITALAKSVPKQDPPLKPIGGVARPLLAGAAELAAAVYRDRLRDVRLNTGDDTSISGQARRMYRFAILPPNLMRSLDCFV